MFNQIINPIPKTHFGRKSISILRKIKQKRILIIFSKTIEKNGFLDKVKEQLLDKEVNCISPNHNNLEELNEVCNVAGNTEVIISLGGGSILDFSKLLRIKLDNPEANLEQINPLLDLNKNIPLIAIPTTPSTGSQVTPIAIIFDKEKNEKRIFLNEALIPDRVILDPQFLSTINKRQMAEFICDIFAHSVESYLSRLSNFFIKNLAEMNIKNLVDNWKEYNQKEPIDSDILDKIAINGQIGGICQGNAYVGIIHAIVHQLEVLKGISHSRALLNVISPCLEWYLKTTNNEIYSKFLDSFNQMKLGEYYEDILSGVDTEELAIRTLKEPSIKTSPVIFNEEMVKEVIQWISMKKSMS